MMPLFRILETSLEREPPSRLTDLDIVQTEDGGGAMIYAYFAGGCDAYAYFDLPPPLRNQPFIPEEWRARFNDGLFSGTLH